MTEDLHTAVEAGRGERGRGEGVNQGSLYTPLAKGSHAGKSEFQAFFLF